MKIDQDLIFEAYTKTLNEGSHLYGDTELGPGKYKASDVTITDYDIEDLAPVGVGGGYEMVPVEFEDDNGTTMTGIVDSLYIDDTGAVDASGMIHDAEVGTLEERYPEEDAEGGGSGILEQLEIFMSNNPATEQELAPILNELLEVAEELVRFDEFMDGEDQDEYLYLLNKLSTTAKT